jgi:Fe-S-cluster containining protein
VKLELPTIQNWSCLSCAGCCTQHEVEITEAERQRIADQNWTAADGLEQAPGTSHLPDFSSIPPDLASADGGHQ